MPLPSSIGPSLTNRVDHLDLTALSIRVASDLDIARNWTPGTRNYNGKRSGTEKGFRKRG